MVRRLLTLDRIKHIDNCFSFDINYFYKRIIQIDKIWNLSRNHWLKEWLKMENKNNKMNLS